MGDQGFDDQFGGEHYEAERGFDDQGFDDQFDDGLFRTGLRQSARQRPSMWPGSVSEMRRHTQYGDQGHREDEEGPRDYNDGLFQTTLRHSAQYRPAMWPSSVTGMRRHMNFGGQALASDDDSAAHSDQVAHRQRAAFHMPFWHDLSHPKNQGPAGASYSAPQHSYYDPRWKTWRWIDSAADSS